MKMEWCTTWSEAIKSLCEIAIKIINEWRKTYYFLVVVVIIWIIMLKLFYCSRKDIASQSHALFNDCLQFNSRLITEWQKTFAFMINYSISLPHPKNWAYFSIHTLELIAAHYVIYRVIIRNIINYFFHMTVRKTRDYDDDKQLIWWIFVIINVKTLQVNDNLKLLQFAKLIF